MTSLYQCSRQSTPPSGAERDLSEEGESEEEVSDVFAGVVSSVMATGVPEEPEEAEEDDEEDDDEEDEEEDEVDEDEDDP